MTDDAHAQTGGPQPPFVRARPGVYTVGDTVAVDFRALSHPAPWPGKITVISDDGVTVLLDRWKPVFVPFAEVRPALRPEDLRDYAIFDTPPITT